MQDRDSADLNDFTNHVWSKDIAEVGDGTVLTALSRANSFLRKGRYPRVLEKARDPRDRAVIRWA